MSDVTAESAPVVRMGFLGPEGTFSDQAAGLAAPEAVRVPFGSIVEVVDARAAWSQ